MYGRCTADDETRKRWREASSRWRIVRDKLDACIAQTPDTWDYATEVALVGGIIINRYKGGDFFQPLCFESRSRDAPPVDLFEQAFGKKPDLTPILGAEAAAKLLKQ